MGYALTKTEYYSLAEYFEVEAHSKRKYEYFFGEIIAMAGGSLRHNALCINMVFAFKNKMKDTNCGIFMSDVKLQVIENEMYVYPDIVITCSEEDLGEENMIHSPSLIVEVLSKSTAAFDLNEKLKYYLKIPSIFYYLTIEQKKVGVILHTKTTNGWNARLYEDLSEVIELPLLNMEIAVAEIYEKIQFPIRKNISKK
jgi:Uma2 family endonuclease